MIHITIFLLTYNNESINFVKCIGGNIDSGNVLFLIINLELGEKYIMGIFDKKIAIFSSNWINLDKQAFPMPNASRSDKILEFLTRIRHKNWHNHGENSEGFSLKFYFLVIFTKNLTLAMKIGHVWLVLNPQTIYLGVCKVLDKNNLIKRLNVNGCDVFYGFLSGPKQIFH